MLIIFDLDDTLIDTSGSILPFKLEKALEVMSAKGLSLSDFNKGLKVLKEIDSRCESTKDALKEFLEIHDAEPHLLEIGLHEVYRKGEFFHEVIPTKNAVETLVELSKKYTLCLVSIGVKEIQLEKMKKAGIDTSLFSRIEICEEHHKKTSYQNLLNDLNIQSTEVFVCGDRIQRDLLPGKSLGFKTIHMRWGRGLHQKTDMEEVDFSIDSLDQIKPILMQFDNH